MSTKQPKSQPDLSQNIMVKLQKQIFGDFGGGPKILPLRYMQDRFFKRILALNCKNIIISLHIINLQKGGTLPYVLFLMKYYNNYSTGCYLYAALHGSYGLMWLLKDFTFPDKSWESKGTIGTISLASSVLIGYWVSPYLLATGQGIQSPTNLRMFATIFTYVIGVVMMMVSDAQKYYTLKYKKGLIDNGMFKYTRNPNYLGEILLYLSFAMVVGHPVSYAIPMLVWCTAFILNMYCKDLSLKRKDGWDEYGKRSWMLIPKIGGSAKLSFLIYGVGLLVGWDIYSGSGNVLNAISKLISFMKK